jgi:serine/threonine-protein kinase
VKVLDFGISKSPHVTDTGRELGLTKSSAVMGSPLYMSPEQMSSSKHVDGRADIWSLGVTLFELLAGKTPFHGESITELIATVLQNPPLPLRQLRPDLPPGIEVALLKSLEKKRESRYQTILAFAEAVAPFGNRHASYHLERISQVLGTAPSVATSAGSVDTPSLALAQTEQVALAETQPLGLAATEPVQPTGGQATASAWGAGNRSSGERARRRGGRVAVGAFAVVGVIAAAGGGIYWAAANRPGRADTSAAAMLPAASNALLAAATPVASNLGGPSLAPSTPASSAAASNPAIRIDADASAAGMGQASPPRRPPVAGPGPARPNGGSAAPPVPAASPAAPTATARTNTGNPVTDMGVH